MTVGIDIVIDPSGAVSGGRTATASLDQVGNAADSAEAKIATLEKQIAVASVRLTQGSKAAAQFASTQSLAGRATDYQRVRIEQLTGELFDLNSAMDKSSGVMGKMSAGGLNVANVGYQVQDAMVQAQMGTSGFVIAAQQLPQALMGLGAFGSILGTAVAVTAVGLMALNPQLANTETGAEKLTKTMKSLNSVVEATGVGALRLSDDFLKLQDTSERLAKVQLALAFSEAQVAMKQASDAALEATNDFSTFFTDIGAGAVNLAELDKRTEALFGRVAKSVQDVANAGTFAGQGQIINSVELLSDKFKIAESDALSLLRGYQNLVKERSPENIQAFSDTVSEITLNTPKATVEFRKFAVDVGTFAQKAASAKDVLDFVDKAMKGLTTTINQQKNSAEGYTQTVVAMSNDLLVLQQQLKGNDREATVLAATNRLGANATKEQREQVALLAGQAFDLEQKLRGVNEVRSNMTSDTEYLSGIEREIGLVGLSARQQAILRAEYSLSADATDEQIAKARELAAALYDAKEAQRPADTSDRDFEASVTGASLAIAAENMTLLEELENQRQMVLLYQETGIGDANAHAKALVAIQRKTYIEQANVAASGFGSLLRLQQAYGDDSSGIYKTLLIAQKTATLYSVLLSSYDAIGKAWASAPFPANLPAVATATVETGALAGLVEAVTPAFATGGYVHGAGTGTSDSIPARLSMGEFVMPARETSRYAPELNAMRSGTYNGGNGAAKVTVINQTTGRVDSAEAEWVSRDELIVTLREEVPSIVAGEFNDPYSQTNRAMQQSYVMQRNL